MGRSKIPITWIKSDASRQVTFNKRKKGMKKKAEELAILCGVDVCMICFGPTVTGSGKHQHNNQSSTGGNNQQPQSSAGSSSSSSASANSSMSVVPFSWGMPGVSTVINKFEGLPKEERDKKKLDNTSLLEQQIKKLRRELKAKLDQNWKLEQERAYFALDERLDCYTVDELKRLADCLLEKLRITFERISYWEQQQQEQEQQHQQVVVHQEPCSGEVEEFTSSHGAKLVTTGFMSFVNPFSVLPSQQPQLNLNPLLVQPGGAPGLIMDDSENSSLLPMGIGQTSSSHLVPNNHVWSASPSEAVVTTTTYNQVGGGDEEWEQSPDENGAPMLHSMLLSAITENSDESKPETDQTDFQAQLQQEATQNDYL